MIKRGFYSVNLTSFTIRCLIPFHLLPLGAQGQYLGTLKIRQWVCTRKNLLQKNYTAYRLCEMIEFVIN